jgi:GntR family transcriptional regulator
VAVEERPALQPLETKLLPQRVKQVLVDAIVDGALDGTLPSEHELAKQLAVSRATVRGALRSLEEEGLITRQRGVGTRINAHIARARLTLNRVVGFWDLIQEAGHTPSIAYTRIRSQPAGLQVGQRMGCSPDTPLVVIDRLFLADGEPAILVAEMIQQKDLRREIKAQEVHESIFEFASEHAVEPIDHTVVEIIPAVADASLGEVIGMEVGEPLLRLIETHYARSNHRLMVSEIHVVDRFVRFNIVRRRT